MVLFRRDKIGEVFKQHLLRLRVDALWEAAWGRYYGSGNWSRHLVRGRQPGQRWGLEAAAPRRGPCEAPRLCRPAVGRAGRARGGPGRGAGLSGMGGAAVGLGGERSPPTGGLSSGSLSGSRASVPPAGAGGGSAAAARPPPSRCRRLGLPRGPGRNLGAGFVVPLWLQPCWGQWPWRVRRCGTAGCRHTRFAARARRSRGCGAAGEPRSAEPPGLATLRSWQGDRS